MSDATLEQLKEELANVTEEINTLNDQAAAEPAPAEPAPETSPPVQEDVTTAQEAPVVAQVAAEPLNGPVLTAEDFDGIALICQQVIQKVEVNAYKLEGHQVDLLRKFVAAYLG